MSTEEETVKIITPFFPSIYSLSKNEKGNRAEQT